MPEKIGYAILENFVRGGFLGKIYPVNPDTTPIFNLSVYPSVKKIPDEVELAVIAVKAAIVPQILKECVEKKIKAVVIISAGFSEIGESGRKLEEKCKKIIERKNIRVLGPNVIGVYDSSTAVDTLFLSRDRMQRPPQGSIAFISQSGAVGSTILDWLAEEKIGISKFISYGNAMDVNEADLLEFLAEDEKTKVVVSYLEGIKSEGKKFIATAKKIAKKKPIIVLKAGKTEKGTAAVLSHTGSLAGSAKIYSSVFKQTGIIEANSFEELFDFARAFSQPLPKGSKVAIITDGGGFGVLATDECERQKLQLPEPSKKLKQKFKKIFPSYVILNNPIDLCFSSDTEVLTIDGWKYFNELNYDDKIATLDAKTNFLSYQKPSNIVKLNYNGDMIKVAHRTVNLLVMPNHMLYFKKLNSKTFERIMAEEVFGMWGEFKRDALWKGQNHKFFILPSIKAIYSTGEFKSKRTFYKKEVHIKMDDWLRFLGIFISEGSLHSRNKVRINCVRIHQSSYSKHLKAIRNILARLPFRVIERKEKSDLISFYINSTQLAEYLTHFGLRSSERHITKEFKNLSPRQLRILFNSLMLGDGYISPNGTKTYITSSKQLADDVQELALKIGLSATIKLKKRQRFKSKTKKYGIKYYECKQVYHVGILSTKYNTPLVKRRTWQKESYNGKVYCVSVPNKVIYVRRNEIPVWCGNTGDATAERYQTAMEECLRSSEYDGVIAITLFQVPTLKEKITEIVADLAKKYKKPILCCAIGSRFTRRLVEILQANNIPVYPTPERTVKAFVALSKYSEFLKKKF
jgi:acyl-CoA synthetase (NDP forming)